MSRKIIAVVFCLLMLLIALSAFAQQDVDKSKLDPVQILKGMDNFTNGFADQEMDITFNVYDVNGSIKKYDALTQQKGREKRLIRFKSGEMKGMSILTEENDRMYVYLPGYKRVRRIAAHNMNQSFVGSDYSNNDMAACDYSRDYDAVITREDGKFWWLTLTPKAGKKLDYAKLVMKISKDVFRMWETEYYNNKGELLKVFSIEEPKDFGTNVTWPGQVQMRDARTGHKTILTIHTFKVDQGLKDSMFTQRYLQWAR